MKIISLIGTFISLISVFVDAQHEKDPFLLSIDVNSPDLLELPSTTIPSVYDLYEGKEPQSAEAACPANAEKKKVLLKLSKKLPYCLFEKSFRREEMKLCEEEVMPMLRRQYTEINHMPRSCGTNPKHHHMYEYGFYYCGTSETLNQLLDDKNKKQIDKFVKPRFFAIYELCADSPNRRALWTKHHIRTPAIFLNKNPEEIKKLEAEATGDSEKISTSDLPHNMKEKKFNGRENNFTHQRTKYDNKVTTKTFMVPKEHVAIRMWRRALNHFINVAPYTKNRKKLMLNINDGIKELALKVHKEGKRLDIYTAVRRFDKGKRGGNWSDVQQSLVWYKLLYEEVNKLATLIVLHSSENETTPVASGCKTTVTFEIMQDWIAKVRKSEPNEVPRDLTPFVFSCKTDPIEVEEIFKFRLEIRGTLNLDAYRYEKITENEQKPPSAPPMQPTVPLKKPGNRLADEIQNDPRQ